jgi:hypothetical protein
MLQKRFERIILVSCCLILIDIRALALTFGNLAYKKKVKRLARKSAEEAYE